MKNSITHPPYDSPYASAEDDTIFNVIGFDLSGDVVYVDEDGNEQPVRTGCKTVNCAEIPEMPEGKVFVPEWSKDKGLLDKSFFNHFDENLLNKIRDYRSVNYNEHAYGTNERALH